MRDTTLPISAFPIWPSQCFHCWFRQLEKLILAKKKKKKGVERSVHLFVFVGPGEGAIAAGPGRVQHSRLKKLVLGDTGIFCTASPAQFQTISHGYVNSWA